MKKTILTAALIATGLVTSTAMAMDIKDSTLSKTQSANQPVVFSKSNFADSEYPASGVYFGVEAAKTKLNGKQSKMNVGDGASRTSLTNSQQSAKSTTEFGVEIGYQDSAITNHILKFLQVKRVSLGVELYHTGETQLKGSYMGGGQPIYTYTTKIESSNRIMLDGKVNIFKIWHLSPYINAGIGMGKYQAQLNTTYLNGTAVPGTAVKKTKMVYQFGAGLDWFVSRGLTMGIGYQYVDAGKLALKNTAAKTNPTINLNYGAYVMHLDYSF